MKIAPIFITMLLATATFSLSVQGAQTFGSSTEATTDTDVYNAGTGKTAFAFDYNDLFNDTTTTVNGVTFTGDADDTATGVSLSLTNLSLALATFQDGAHNGVDTSGLASGATANYAAILTSLAYGNNGEPAKLTLSGLKAGDTYQLQIFAGTEGADGSESVTDVTTVPGPTPPSPAGNLDYGSNAGDSDAAFIDESFTATSGGTETINIDAAQGDYLILNAVNLQITATPEPATYAMLLGGLGCLIFLARRKSLRPS
jgi:hypothetical protein